VNEAMVFGHLGSLVGRDTNEEGNDGMVNQGGAMRKREEALS